MATWTKIKSEGEYKNALNRINELMDAERTDAVRNELGLLSYLIEEYEEEVYPMPDASPLEVIKLVMEMKGIKQQDLIPILGTKGNVSKILRGNANLQLADIHPLSTLLGIPVEALIPKGDHPYAAIGTIAEYTDSNKMQEMDVMVQDWSPESSPWGVPAEEKPKLTRKKRNKIKR